jgi:type II secretory pathway component PulC
MKKLLILLFAASAFAQDSPYNGITKRNAFELTVGLPKPVLPPVAEILKPTLYLTGLTHFKGVRKAHLVLRKSGEPDRFVSLAINEKQYNVELKKINKNSALISNNGNEELVSFENDGLPTTVTKAPVKKVLMERSSSRSSRGKESSKKEEKKSAPAPAKAHIVQVPSRKSQIDPRIIEKGLEYISKIDDQEKKEHIMKRLESLQSGQYKIKSDIDQNERRRQYDEWRKRRDGK